MIASFLPSKAIGDALTPPSKSVAHRALICGALSQGSVIHNIAFSKDIEATLGCLKAMGAKVEISGSDVKIGGLCPKNLPDNLELFCNESGSTLRFFIPFAFLQEKMVKFCGSERLMSRPLNVYKDIAKIGGATFKLADSVLTVGGKLNISKFSVPGNVSSQFITGLLFALPLSGQDSEIVIEGKLESASYIDITLDVLQTFGVAADKTENGYFIKGNQKYIAADYTVEGDCSNAAMLEAFNLIGGKVNVLGVPSKTCQGDSVYKDIFEKMVDGVRRFNLSDCPDLAPILFSVAAALGGDYLFEGTARLKIKESDRASAMAEELAKLGGKVEVASDSVYIKPCKLTAPTDIIDSHNDHRIVMAMSLLCSIFGGKISGAEAVSKSFPDYFDTIKSFGIKVDLI